MASEELPLEAGVIEAVVAALDLASEGEWSDAYWTKVARIALRAADEARGMTVERLPKVNDPQIAAGGEHELWRYSSDWQPVDKKEEDQDAD